MDKINEFREKLRLTNIKGLALDIDETLADSNYAWFESMFKFHAPEDTDIESVMKEYKFVEKVPGWDTREAFNHMEMLMHSEEFNETVPLIEDSNHIVDKIDKIIPILVYITARPQTVIGATKRWLKKHGFPEAELITRSADIKAGESDLIDRNKWKAEILVNLYPYVQGIIDDNKTLAHKLHELDYQGTLYLYGTDSEEFGNYKHVVVCPTWRSVLDKIKS